MKTLEILPQKIFKFKCEPNLILKTLDALKSEEFILAPAIPAWAVAQTKNKRLNKDPKYSEIHSWVRECFNKVKDEMNFRCDKIEITLSWGNVASQNQWQWTHSHPNSFMSAILYLTDSNASTIFKMHNFWTGSNNNLDSSNASNIVQLLPEGDDIHNIHKQSSVSGDLIIFPSSLIHRVDTHIMQGNNRYSMSFNSYPCGIVGDIDGSAGMILEVL